MTDEEVYESWANPTGPWSDWVKPAIFHGAFKVGVSAQGSPIAPLGRWAPRADAGTAVVVDLPGDGALVIGRSLAATGFQPVPLYNCCDGRQAVLNVKAIIHRLWSHADEMKRYAWAPETPPAFLLDAHRHLSRRPAPGHFDNRWVVLPQDFPSAALLQSRKLHSVLLVQERIGQPQNDLMHVLRRWQQAGMKIYATSPAEMPQPLTVSKPRHFRAALWAMLAMIGLIRSSAGGFGGVVPMPSSSTG